MSESGANEGTPMLWHREKGEMLMLKSEIPRDPAGVGIPGHVRQQHLLGSGVPGDGRRGAELCAGKGWVVSGKEIRRKTLL